MSQQTLSIYANSGGNTVQGIWTPTSYNNTIGKAGLLVKVVAPASGTKAAVQVVTAATDVPTDILLDDGGSSTDTDNTGKFVTCAPLESFDQFRVPVVGSGNAGDKLVLGASANLGKLVPVTGTGVTYNRVFQALENYASGQNVLVRRYPGTIAT